MSAAVYPIARFRLGRIVSTPNALEQLTRDDILLGIQRHQAGDWGDVSQDDREANDQALRDGTRLCSVYHSATGIKFWIITEANRHHTMVLLPRDY